MGNRSCDGRVKKLQWRSTFDLIEIIEPLFREGSRTIRAFSVGAGVSYRGLSRPLQRVMTDFGADLSFAQAALKVQEHYGIDVPVSALREVTEQHGAVLFEQTAPVLDWPETDGADYVVAETDGGMVPVVSVDPEADDKRKGKQLHWKELRLSLAHELGSQTVHYGGNFSGGIEEAGRQLYDCALKANFGQHTQPDI